MTRRRFKNWNSKEKNEAKPVSFKRKNKEIAKRKIIELEMEIKVETIIKTGESKRKILREVTDIFF